jgi:carboxyl-terminal processing protease
MCTDLRQKQFVRSYLDEVYLWPEQVQRRQPLDYTSARTYFDAILAPATVDRFSFSATTDEANERESNQAFDVGIVWRNTGSNTSPIWRIARVEPNSPADKAELERGDTLAGYVSTNLYTAGATAPFYYNFSYNRGGSKLTAKLVPAPISEDPVGIPVLIEQNANKVGYIAFEAHYGDAQDQLIDAAIAAKEENITDLVLDLRYNSGGFLYMAASLASMIAPSTSLNTQATFVRLVPNSKLQSAYQNEVIPLSSKVIYHDSNAKYIRSVELPSLNLNRVYVLTTDATCSASESLINGLRGVDVEVHLIGSTTCGKPFGMTRQDNCGSSFYPVEFRGVNAKGTADFSNGFAPTCAVADDLDHQRDDPNEAMFKAALNHIATGSCPAASQGVLSTSAAQAQMSPTPLGLGYVPPQRARPGMALVQTH